ncbi:anaphase-promoting complex subunit 10 [Sporothrix schenckii 1099-18]|uniref:Anaphase-promoting complex subunit 10 n=1 Tax=Sporothrix schenckii 1099-18 TaxID=1397361 RepID=A0A0F2LYQ0_SPOSC|nr:anaphase-promoting complex subunit 10 [Sporothrix schenckii 1099-18]KJR81959.1 anaphase-promoting complex subunit 10 [Sporothrix schenckii 1099-18]
MDPSNPLRGPRRAARRGEEALRYDRPGGFRAASASASASAAATATPPSLPFPPGPPPNLRYARGAHSVSPAVDPYGNQFAASDDTEEDDADMDDDAIADNLMAQMAQMARLRGGRPPPGARAGAGRHALDGDDSYEYEDDEDHEGQDAAADDDEGMDEDDDDSPDDEFEFAAQRVVDSDSDSDDDDEAVGDDDDDDEEEEEEEDDDLHGPVGEEGVDVVDEDDADGAAVSFDPVVLGLKEINNLAHFSVSSHKPGNGVDELLHDDLGKYWQSDGPQPHLLTIHFLRRVEIRAIRFYVDYNQDESYTPTSVVLSAGTGHHDLLEFASLALTTPVGWQDIDLSQVGGGADGRSLCCWIVQIRVKENHQNGKDTHIRGIKLYAVDENAPPADSALDELALVKARTLQLPLPPQEKQRQLVLEQHLGRVGEALYEQDDDLFERLITQPLDGLPGAPERSGSIATFLRDEEIR